ncbi:hypothetical protein [Thalassospira sp.]|uniref:hypothetical protein n=1 Tax=Thalassospira sp. TaxID=1912094 RepID=UPI000C64C57C|nr:hypothetical protein [Thalassospira sp.]MAL38766.1 hypothetical protein [Thalassospira sp.]HAY49631.1 hypothetical protein [Thalassospira sp.]|tara:strand:- start:1425 stop:1778 length:354 start_codon:yes stop_codon:yes gene_type:complete
MVSVSSSSDLQTAIPVRPNSPIAQRQQSEQELQQQNQAVERTSRAALTSDQEIDRAVQAYERDRNEQQRFVKEGAQDTVLENYIDQFDPSGYGKSGSANSASANNAAGRGQYINILA